MGIFARIEHGVVAELIVTERDIGTMFHSALHWVDASDTPGVSPGWRHDGEKFVPPAEPAQPAETPGQTPTQG